MACPYFEPLEPLDDAGGKAAMLPLGGVWSGACRAAGGEAWRAPDAASRLVCNFGYARGRCGRFPDGAGPDAVRFSIAASPDGALAVRYAIERDHLPHSHGTLEARALEAPSAALLELQARAYLHNHLRRRGGAPASG